MVVAPKLDFEAWSDLVPVLALSFTSCVILGRSFDFFEPYFRENNNIFSQNCQEVYLRYFSVLLLRIVIINNIS